ncbi:MAG: prolyl oligopeptidase family serine peptidase [Bryobacteraceae bacterium]
MNRFLLVPAFAFCLIAAERPVPAPGVAVAEADRTALQNGLKKLESSIAALRAKHGPRSLLVADVRIFYDAVRYGLEYNEFLKAEEVFRAKDLLKLGQQRADELAAGRAPWTKQTGLVVRGYVSKIDDSVQPYGLVIPESFGPEKPHSWRLDAWFHGRSETLTEGNFLWDRINNPGQFTPPDTIVLHLYGRFCNANKFAGEVDLFEALDAVKQQYRIDERRISMRGFSMGGAAVWHIAAHYAGLWASAAPGAGFSETAEFLNVFQNEKVQPNWWEKKLWRLYDATVYAENFFNLPVVAYSGEVDRQMQAAKVMEREMAKEGMTLRHIIGPGTPHRYHPDSKVKIDEIVDALAAKGREAYPRKIRFTTYTLAYDRMKWVRVDAMAHHWERAHVEAEVESAKRIRVATSGVTAFTLDFGPGGAPMDAASKATVAIDGTNVEAPAPASDRSFTASFVKSASGWKLAGTEEAGLRKRHGLQGPIDDAFMDRFIIVKPTGSPMLSGSAAWVDQEMKRAITEWRRHFRGEAIVKNDTVVTDEDIRTSNLALWGDPGSNHVLGRLAAKLPVAWSADSVAVGARKFAAATHAPVLVYPNPLNPSHYVVVNSGFTFREYDYLNNARQIPKLPDFAIIDTTTPPDSRWPGKVAYAGFFGEKWEVVENQGQ